VCPLFHEFRNLGDFAKLMGHKYLKSMNAIFIVLLILSSSSKNAKIKGAKIIKYTELTKLRAAKITGFKVLPVYLTKRRWLQPNVQTQITLMIDNCNHCNQLESSTNTSMLRFLYDMKPYVFKLTTTTNNNAKTTGHIPDQATIISGQTLK